MEQTTKVGHDKLLNLLNSASPSTGTTWAFAGPSSRKEAYKKPGSSARKASFVRH